MSHAVKIRLTKELAAWLEGASKRSGMPRRAIMGAQLEKAHRHHGNPGRVR
jgi:hypothetical protein